MRIVKNTNVVYQFVVTHAHIYTLKFQVYLYEEVYCKSWLHLN